jgi:hypothetical protein
MGKRTFILPSSFLLLILLTGCFTDPESGPSQPVTGYQPVYGPQTDTEILMTETRTVEDPGKIYVYGEYLLVNEKKKGIHVFSNSNPSEPVNLGFLQLLGNTDMAIKDGVLYADHVGQVVALTLNNFTNVIEKDRLPLRNWDLGLPPPPGFYFECVNPDRGLVVGWKQTILTNAQCYALQ